MSENEKQGPRTEPDPLVTEREDKGNLGDSGEREVRRE